MGGVVLCRVPGIGFRGAWTLKPAPVVLSCALAALVCGGGVFVSGHQRNHQYPRCPRETKGVLDSHIRHTFLKVEVTAYCSCAVCCGKYSPERGGKGLTASGTIPREGRTLAADWSIFPKGTTLRFAGWKVAKVVEDTGSAIIGHRLDVFMDSHEEAKQFGRRKMWVEVVRP